MLELHNQYVYTRRDLYKKVHNFEKEYIEQKQVCQQSCQAEHTHLQLACTVKAFRDNTQSFCFVHILSTKITEQHISLQRTVLCTH